MAVNCSVGDDVDGGGDNGGYYDEEPDNSYYNGGHSQCQLYLAEKAQMLS